MDEVAQWRTALEPFAELHDIFDGFERYLTPDSAEPLGVAVSGGGDSVALLYLLHLWGCRRLEVFSVNHGLNPLGADWCAQVEALARHLGHGFTQLNWIGDKPTTGIQAAARQARHGLMADAARSKGIKVICLGHNRDDGIEARLMRDMGSNVSAPDIWSPSPVWPQGRGVFIFRPLLTVPRQVLRDWLTAIGVSWVDDPANDNPKFLRTQARRQLAAMPSDAGARDTVADVSALLSGPQPLAWAGIISLSLEYLLSLPHAEAHRLMAVAMVSAGGGQTLPRSDRVAAIVAALKAGASGPFGLSGARCVRLDDSLLIGREAGDMVRQKIAPLTLSRDEAGIWDGRFEIRSTKEAAIIKAVQGHKTALSAVDLARYLQVPAGLRGALPVVETVYGGRKALVLLSEPDNSAGIAVKSKVHWRFYAALGLMKVESDQLW